MKRYSQTNLVELASLLKERTSQSLNEIDSSLTDQTAGGALARGRLFSLYGLHEEAIDCFSDALSLDRDLDDALIRLAITQLKAGYVEAALKNAMVLAARNPNFEFRAQTTDEVVSAMTILGDALAASERLEDAIEAYKIAIKINPQGNYTPARLAQVYLATGNQDEAVELAPQFANNLRFADLHHVLSLGRESKALLPKFNSSFIRSQILSTVVGRPFSVRGSIRLAELVQDNNWCVDIQDILLDNDT
ncbi:MAG: hypothetical protein KME42_08415 [Tildeniella nuda ZEHNDER 1965/U140]|jgi:tetratricopeptide (TPR) repeat protein|nr:hypothetical protein [Tildeniella nuda ZEHNDER 1965/U140]